MTAYLFIFVWKFPKKFIVATVRLHLANHTGNVNCFRRDRCDKLSEKALAEEIDLWTLLPLRVPYMLFIIKNFGFD